MPDRVVEARVRRVEMNIESVGGAVALLRDVEDVRPDRALRFLAVDALSREDFRPGTPLAAGGRATVDYVAAAMRFVAEGHATAIVACPHSETNVNAAGIPFSGYPSLLARLMKVPEDEVFLMLVGGGLRIVHVTLHERLAPAEILGMVIILISVATVILSRTKVTSPPSDPLLECPIEE